MNALTKLRSLNHTFISVKVVDLSENVLKSRLKGSKPASGSKQQILKILFFQQLKCERNG